MAITDEESKENKPITSTPLHNGSCSSSGSDDDAPLRRPANDDSLIDFNSHSQINHVIERYLIFFVFFFVENNRFLANSALY